MEDSKPVGTPMTTRHKLSKNDDSKEVDQTTYRSMIGKLQYVVHTRLDIALTVGMVERFSTNSKKITWFHSKESWDIWKVLKTMDYYTKKEGNLDLKTFIDVDWVGSVDDRKSRGGGAFFLGKRLVSWTSKKKICIS